MVLSKYVDRQILNALIVTLIVIIVGTIGYAQLEGYSLIEGVYMTIITITTVGYGEIKPLSTAGRVFTSFLILFGFISLAYVGRAFAENFFSKIMNTNSEKRKMLKEISQLKSHYIICGFGRVGYAVAEKLQASGTKMVLIESDSNHCQSLKEDNYFFIEGNAISDRILQQANIKNAVGLLAILPSVADNLFITLTARELNPTLHIIARADNTTSEKRLLQAGADIVISPYTSAGHQIAKMMLKAAGIVNKENNTDQMLPAIPQWIDVEKGSELIGKCVGDIFNEKEHKVLGLRRDGNDILDPDDEIEIKLNDKLYLLENNSFKQETDSKKPSKIVIVDDNPAILKLYTRLFRQAGYYPLLAHNSDEAFEIIRQEKPQAAVIDYILPGMSGIDICKNLRNGKNVNKLKIILFTSDNNEGMHKRALKAGADAVVIKSADASELINTVEELLLN